MFSGVTSGDPGSPGNWRSFADPTAWHRVTEVIPGRVIHVKNNDLQQLKARARNVVATVSHNKFHNRWTEVEYSLDTCRATMGTQTETS